MFDIEEWSGTPRARLVATRGKKTYFWEVWVARDSVYISWGVDGGKASTAVRAAEAKNVGRANETTPEEQALLEARSAYRAQVKKRGYSPPGPCAPKPPAFYPMLAHTYAAAKSRIDWVDGVYAQRKLNGVRCLAYKDPDGRLVLQSRRNDYFKHLPHIEALLESLPPGVTLDGELYHHGRPLNAILSDVRGESTDASKIRYVLYDMYFDDAPSMVFGARIPLLYRFVDSLGPTTAVTALETVTCNSPQHAQELHDYYVSLGYEGLILRSRQGTYRKGLRSFDLIKMKAFEDAEFRVTGWKRGTGKFEQFPVFTCVTDAGVEFDVMPKGTDAERAKLLRDADTYIGKMLNVRYIGWTAYKKPNHAVGLYFREGAHA